MSDPYNHPAFEHPQEPGYYFARLSGVNEWTHIARVYGKSPYLKIEFTNIANFPMPQSPSISVRGSSLRAEAERFPQYDSERGVFRCIIGPRLDVPPVTPLVT